MIETLRFALCALLIGLGLVYNLDKKSVEQMNKELAARHAKSEEVE